MIKDYSELTSKIYVQLAPELSQEFHNMLTNMATELSRLYEIDSAKPSEALGCLHWMGKHRIEYGGEFLVPIKGISEYKTIKNYILKAQELDDNLTFENGKFMSGFNYKEKQIVAMPLSEYSRLMDQERILSIIKEKCVDVGYVIMSFVYKDYNSKMDELWGDKAPSYYLTEKEFGLLKRYLVNE